VTPTHSVIKQHACTSGVQQSEIACGRFIGVFSSAFHFSVIIGNDFTESSNLSEHKRLPLFGDFVPINHLVAKSTSSVQPTVCCSEKSNL
jgi:hypothetical protein